MLTAEFQELNQNARFLFDQYIRWATFFASANLIGWGWFVSQLAGGKDYTRLAQLVWAVCILFVIEAIGAILMSRIFLKHARMHRARMDAVAALLSAHGGTGLSNPFPFALAEPVVNLFLASFVAFIPLWLFVADFVAFHKN